MTGFAEKGVKPVICTPLHGLSATGLGIDHVELLLKPLNPVKPSNP